MVTIPSLVTSVKRVILEANDMLTEAQLEITSFSITLSVATTLAHSAGPEFKLGPITIGSSLGRGREKSSAITLKYIPVPQSVEFQSDEVEESLLELIEQLTDQIIRANTAYPEFEMTEGQVKLSFGVTDTGSIKLFVFGRDESWADAHQVVLDFRARR
jgi:hypothetical protein